jgi:carboxyl-terminal processing protease
MEPAREETDYSMRRNPIGVLKLVTSVSGAILIAMLSQGCLPEPYEVGAPDSTLSEYLLIWQLVDQYYACFCVRGDVDWDLAYLDYRSMAEEATSREEMLEASLLMLGELEDQQMAVFDGCTVRSSYDPGRFVNFDLEVWLQYMLEMEPVPDTVLSAFGSGLFITAASDSIGYVYLSDIGEAYSLVDFYNCTNLIRYCPGLILDLRMCGGGGAEANARSAVGRFVAQSALGYYRSLRVGPDRFGMTGLEPIQALKNGSWQYSDPILVLTGRGTCGAAEQLALLLASQEHVVLIGDTTAGFANPGPSFNLAEGWTITVPGMVTYDPALEAVFDRGIPPDIVVPVTQADFTAGIDPVLEAAMEILTSPQDR